MASKKKVLTLDERIKVIDLCKTKSARKVAEELGVVKTQIQSILLWNFINSDF
jgi:IS30 family transposase